MLNFTITMQSYLKNKNSCKIPDKNSYVYKDECVYCFETSDSPSGLYICMKTFIGVCKAHLNLFYKKSKHQLFLNIRIEKRIKIADGDGLLQGSEYQMLLKEAYSKNDVDSREINNLLLMPDYEELVLPCELPEHVASSVKHILSADSLAKSLERGTQGDNWDGNYIQESKYALSLKQLSNGVKIGPSGWKCCYCDLTSNLWMNLTDGTILCGRKFFDGSGGNNHAIEHYQKTHYPLAVKLGTITPAGADVFSYIEDDMVLDPLLGKHLEHFGIDIMKMEKTEKSTEELAVEKIKLNREQMAIMEADGAQELLSGPGFNGIMNVGNSCYLNSVFQVLLSIPAFQKLYTDRYPIIIEQLPFNDDVVDFRVQLSKLGHCLKTGDYSQAPIVADSPVKDGELVVTSPKILPQLLRFIVGKGHPDFSQRQQQDAYEYLMHVLNFVKTDMKRHGDAGVGDPLHSVTFRVEDRIYCQTTGTVKYQYRDELVLSLAIPLDEALNKDQLTAAASSPDRRQKEDDVVRPIIDFQSCLDLFMRPDNIVDYSVKGQRAVAFQSSRLESFPDYLWVHLKRFTVGDNWTPKKLDVEVLVPDRIDLSRMKAAGLQPTETEMTEDVAPVGAELQRGPVELNESVLTELALMGFPESVCRKAVYLTGNSSLEDAANWLMMNIGEPDFEEMPAALVAGAGLEAGAMAVAAPAQSDVDVMVSMGFSERQAVRALRETGSLDRAADWAFCHPDEMAQAEAAPGQSVPAVQGRPPWTDGAASYSLVGLVSHMGNNAHVGHYVCHVRQSSVDDDGGHGPSWVLFNDDIVQRSVCPPTKFAYLYLFKRESPH